MAALFSKPKQPKVPTISDKQIEEERRKRLMESAGRGRSSTILTSGKGVTAPLLGQAASLVGGTL